MALADHLKRFLQGKGRKIPGTLGLRPNAVTIEIRTWDGGKVGRGAATVSTPGDPFGTVGLTILPTPKVREVSTHEVASSGGVYEQGDLVVGPITPAYPGPPAGGYTVEQIAPEIAPDQAGIEVVYLITGPDAGEYRRITANTDRALHFTLMLRRTNRTP